MFIWKEGTLYDTLKGIFWIKEKKGEIGLEIETEVQTIADYPKLVHNYIAAGYGPDMKYWMGKKDGSLRNIGMEYILKEPLKYEDLSAALEEFRNFANKVKFIKDPVKCSTHVHLNFMNEQGKTLGNFLTLYLLYENLLIQYSGPNRLSNMFCLPVKDAEENMQHILDIVEIVRKPERYKRAKISEDICKYGSLNVAAFVKYGSLEVRCFRGETDAYKIIKWVDIIYAMFNYARKSDLYPADIIESYFQNDKQLFKKVFMGTELFYKPELVKSNLWYAGHVAHALSPKEWKESTLIKTIDKTKLEEFKQHVSLNRFRKPYEFLSMDCKYWVEWYVKKGIK